MIQTRKKYSKEFKPQAVELAQAGRPVPELAVELEVGSSLLCSWLSCAPLRVENSKLKLENDILKKSRCNSRDQSPAERHQMIDSISAKTGGGIR